MTTTDISGPCTPLKRCASCAKLKPFDAFWKRKKTKLGRRSSCKDCERAQFRKYYLENDGRIIRKSTRWNEENPLRRREIVAKHYAKKKTGA